MISAFRSVTVLMAVRVCGYEQSRLRVSSTSWSSLWSTHPLERHIVRVSWENLCREVLIDDTAEVLDGSSS